jgi:hypothetical protein
MTDENKANFSVNINEGENKYVEGSCAALVEFSVTVTRKYITPKGEFGFDVLGTERDRYVAQLESDDSGDAINEILANVKKCRENWTVMGVVKDDEESKQEFVDNIKNMSTLSNPPDDPTPPTDNQEEGEEEKDG